MPMMKAPSSGVTVRMYRQGHGDCFLLAFPSTGKPNDRPVFMLIDCGLKPGSEVKPGQTVDKIIADIGEATGNKIDIVVVTHEHQDHVNGFLKKKSGAFVFDKIEIGTVWLAWTENGKDKLANKLRDRFNDTLLGLARTEHRLTAADPNSESLDRIRELLELELGDEGAGAAFTNTFGAVAKENPHLSFRETLALAIKGISNKKAIKYLRDKAENNPLFLRPDRGPYFIPRVKGTKVYALGPPRNEEQLLSLEPLDHEEFKLHGPGDRLGLDGASLSFFKALEDIEGGADASPFSNRFCLTINEVFAPPPPAASSDDRQEINHYRTHYGEDAAHDADSWRKIDTDWLAQGETLALRLNSEVNNTSLVLAFELPSTGKVLLFTGDAQRGSWISWDELTWEKDGVPVSAKELLERTVFYKVGHHGSHNATLKGETEDDYANLSWMGAGDFGDEFVAMIPANTKWALGKKKPWKHPLQAIEDALQAKADGRVFRTDIDKVKKPDSVTAAKWRGFDRRKNETKLFLEYTVFDR